MSDSCGVCLLSPSFMQEGNTPGRLAEQQENRKCALLLQEYQASSVDTEEDDLPQFQYCKILSLIALGIACVLNNIRNEG